MPERLLWSRLRNRRLADLKFRRQVPVGPFVVDFLCESARLAVELDGESHVGRGEQDAARTAFLESRGLRVVRVMNDDVIRNMHDVLEFIMRTALTPDPSPKGRGELTLAQGERG